jgi:hypothetical protein
MKIYYFSHSHKNLNKFILWAENIEKYHAQVH